MRFDYFLWFLATAGLLTVSEVTSEEAPLPGALEEPASDPIPEPYPVSRYQRVWEQSPFQLDAAPVAAVATNRVSFARDYVLVGTIKKGDAYTVYIMNKRTKDVTKVLQDQATSDGFELVSVSPGDGPGRYSAVVKKNNERATLKYEDMATTQARAGSSFNRGANSSNGSLGAAKNVSTDSNGAPLVNPAQQRLEQARAAREKANASGNSQSPASRRRTLLLPKSAKP